MTLQNQIHSLRLHKYTIKQALPTTDARFDRCFVCIDFMHIVKQMLYPRKKRVITGTPLVRAYGRRNSRLRHLIL